MYFREVSYANPRTHTFTASSQNMTFSDILQMEERITYTRDAENSLHTDVVQEAAVEAVGVVSFIKGYVEDFCIGRFHANSEQVLFQ